MRDGAFLHCVAVIGAQGDSFVLVASMSLGRAALAEFVGTLLFQCLGGAEPYAPFNGLILTVVIYMTANASGGVVNPAVALCLLVTGEISAVKFAVYSVVELLGAVFGALLGALADPEAADISWSIDSALPGCVPEIPSSHYSAVFVWEFIGTFMLCATVLTTAVAKPGFGDLAPLAIGLAVAVNVGTSGSITGGCYNPARFFGPALAFGCRLNLIWLYFGAQAAGGVAAAYWHRVHAGARVAVTDGAPLREPGVQLSSSSPEGGRA